MPGAKKKVKRRLPAKPPPPIDPAKVNQAVKWVLSGATPFDIIETIKTTYPDEDPGRLILEAMRHFESAAKSDPTIVIGFCFEATKDLYRRMVETGDYPGALRAIKQLLEMSKYVHDEDADEPEQPEEDDRPKLTAEQATTQAADGTSGGPIAGGPEPQALAGSVPPEQPA